MDDLKRNPNKLHETQMRGVSILQEMLPHFLTFKAIEEHIFASQLVTARGFPLSNEFYRKLDAGMDPLG
jgi:hypothetical protein